MAERQRCVRCGAVDLGDGVFVHRSVECIPLPATPTPPVQDDPVAHDTGEPDAVPVDPGPEAEARQRVLAYLEVLFALLHTSGEMRLADFADGALAKDAVRLRQAVADHIIAMERAGDQGDATDPRQTTEDMCNDSTTPRVKTG